MNAQLLILDTILPSLLAFGGLAFLIVAFVPRIAKGATPTWTVTTALAVAGIACLAVGVFLWLQLLRTQFQLPASAVAPPPSVTASAKSSSQAASPTPSSGSAAASASAKPTVPPAPTATLAPISAITFQPDNSPPHDVTVAVESFEHGLMLYRSDTKQIYVLGDNKTFKVYPDTWDESQPDSGGLTPAAGKLEPKRGFGKLWRANPDVHQLLGWAMSPEAGMGGQVSGDGSSTTIRADLTYVLKKDGTYTTQ